MPRGRRVAALALLAGVAGAGTLAVHGPTAGFGFFFDDYHLVRPYSGHEVAASFHGPWDPSGVETAFYRPLTVAFFAARFHFLGFDPAPYHRLSLALFAAVALLLGVAVLRTTASLAIAAWATALFVVHPAMPIALVAWVTNQMHLLSLLLFLLALLWWTVCRSRSARWWTPLLVLQAAAVLVKEDGVMFGPAMVALHAVYRRTLAPETPPVPRRVLAALAALIVVLVVWRQAALGGEAARIHVPPVAKAAANLLEGPVQVLSARYGTGLGALGVGLFAVAVCAIGLWVARGRGGPATPAARWAVLSGATLVLLFDVPCLLTTKPYQWHFLALGAVLLLAGSVDTVARGLAPPARWAFFGIAVAVLVEMGQLSRAIAHERFGPWSPETIARDFEALGWGDAVPPPLREKLERRTRRHLLLRTVPESQRPPLPPEDR
jgi:hypothetical protein